MDKHESNMGKVKKRVWIFVLIVVAVIVVLVAAAYFYLHHALDPVDANSNEKVAVQIQTGESVADIAHKLDTKGIIHSATIFRYYTKYKQAGNFQAGNYEFSPSMDTDQIIGKMKNGETAVGLKLAIPEGSSITDIAKIIAAHTNQSKKAILNKMKKRAYIKNTYMKHYDFLDQSIFAKKIRYPLEGYLYPATYSFAEKNPSLRDILTKMLDKMATVLEPYQDKMNKKNMSPHKVMTMASLLEKEGTKKGNRRKMASVFYNRLEQGMPLQTDPTIDYAKAQHHTHITYKDLKIKSPYNTYRHKGLPPGPIAMPGKDSIAAAIQPAKTKYLYFYAKLDGKVLFSKTYRKHRKIVKKYNKDWKEYIKKEKKK